jgi:hypothetical protein
MGATSPSPIDPGAQLWSTSLLRLLTWNGTAWGTSGASGTAQVDFGNGSIDSSTVITGQSLIAASSSVIVQRAAIATATHSVDEHVIEEFDVVAGNIVPGVGFTVYGHARRSRLYGAFSVAWRWET